MSRRRSQPGSGLLTAADELVQRLSRLHFADPVQYVYNPLEYVRDGYVQYATRYARRGINVLFLGMNPGPWGMSQTGVPFGEVNIVRDWLGIVPRFTQPQRGHPMRPIEGIACRRSEVSGARLWGLFRARFGTPERFFASNFVANYCPLAFLESSARNRTPDKLPADERCRLYEICNQHLAQVVALLAPQAVVGIGQFAAERARETLGKQLPIHSILHPSPASPAANRDWAGTALRQLLSAGVWPPS